VRSVIDGSQLVGEALRANFCELLRLFQLKRHARAHTDPCDYFTVRTFAGCSALGSLLTGSFQWGRRKWQV